MDCTNHSKAWSYDVREQLCAVLDCTVAALAYVWVWFLIPYLCVVLFYDSLPMFGPFFKFFVSVCAFFLIPFLVVGLFTDDMPIFGPAFWFPTYVWSCFMIHGLCLGLSYNSLSTLTTHEYWHMSKKDSLFSDCSHALTSCTSVDFFLLNVDLS